MKIENKEKMCVECEPTENIISENINNNKFPPEEFLPSIDKIHTVKIDMGYKYANRYIFYYAAESKKMLIRDGKFKEPIYELEAYDDFDNSGIVKLNEKGIVEVFISEPVEYLANDGLVYDKHIHFRISNDENNNWIEDEFTIKITNDRTKHKYYDHVIIGGGIAGLYSAYKLSDKNKDDSILILERNNYLGGRIKTIRKNIDGEEIHFDAGASRLNENHKLVKKLIGELDLTEDIYKLKKTKLIPLSRGVSYNDYLATNKKYNLKSDVNVQDLINRVIEYSNIYNKEFLTSINFIDLATLILSTEEISYIKDIYTYDAELYDLNAYDAKKMFKEDLNLDSNFYILKSGMSIICDKLTQILMKRNVIIMTETEFIEYKYNGLFNIKATHNTKKINIQSPNLVLAIPFEFLKKIKQLKSISNLINSVNQIGLNRIYAKYPENRFDKIWFKGHDKIGTNNILKFIIPISSKTGLIMISYTDSKKATYWNILDNYDLMEKEIHTNITELFPEKNIPPPQFINSYFWKGGIHFYKPGFNYEMIGSKIIKPFENENLFIVGECYSDKQGWIEGSLRSVENMLKLR